ncbi:hypothetical protein NSTCB13_04548 [Nostoc sp. DSM 114160]|jgi:16S rRNA U516 pseudouridylate synthase RsuA-like enzyme
MEVRLQKILAQWGIASRREAEEMIRQSRVRINGVLAHLGQKVDPEKDAIAVDGQPVSQKQRPALIYLLLHKPAGVVSTCYDPSSQTNSPGSTTERITGGFRYSPSWSSRCRLYRSINPD